MLEFTDSIFSDKTRVCYAGISLITIIYSGNFMLEFY